MTDGYVYENERALLQYIYCALNVKVKLSLYTA